MINSIIGAISISLNAEFGDDYEVHPEEIKQDLEEPCFFVFCLNPSTELFLGKRYFKTNNFCIQYFPATDDAQQECNDVAERMTWALEYITLDDGPIRGTNMRYEVVDDVLNFFVNYDYFMYRIEETMTMETMESGTKVKGGD